MKYSSSELIIGLVAPIGVDLNRATALLKSLLETKFKYTTHIIKLSDEIKKIPFLKTLPIKPEYKRIGSYMDGGNEIRKKTGQDNAVAALAIGSIQKLRKEKPSLERTVFILSSLKHPDEVGLLRDIYGEAFYLLGFTNSDKNRTKYLTDELSCTKNQAESLRNRDESENKPYGQHTRDVFKMADAYFNLDDKEPNQEIHRILKLIFSDPFTTPTKDEYAMYLATAASLRSGDLSRQVGAVIMNQEGDIIATGTNDVPRYGGGLYWEGDPNDKRDLHLGKDLNQQTKREIFLNLLKEVTGQKKFSEADLQKYEPCFIRSGLSDITEYGRAVHAEMEALLSCARNGISVRNAILYSTTFPCHNCAKHIVAAGIQRVVFIEPYPKSYAMRLHYDSIISNFVPHPEPGKKDGVRFEPFVGLGPRKFIDLFSLRLSRGEELRRKDNKTGEKIHWKERTAKPRLVLKLISYTDSEKIVLSEITQQIEEIQNEEKKSKKKEK